MTADHARKKAVRAAKAEHNVSYGQAAQLLADKPIAGTRVTATVVPHIETGWALHLVGDGIGQILPVVNILDDIPYGDPRDPYGFVFMDSAADALTKAGWGQVDSWVNPDPTPGEARWLPYEGAYTYAVAGYKEHKPPYWGENVACYECGAEQDYQCNCDDVDGYGDYYDED